MSIYIYIFIASYIYIYNKTHIHTTIFGVAQAKLGSWLRPRPSPGAPSPSSQRPSGRPPRACGTGTGAPAGTSCARSTTSASDSGFRLRAAWAVWAVWALGRPGLGRGFCGEFGRGCVALLGRHIWGSEFWAGRSGRCFWVGEEGLAYGFSCGCAQGKAPWPAGS